MNVSRELKNLNKNDFTFTTKLQRRKYLGVNQCSSIALDETILTY